MIRALYSAAGGMLAQQIQLDVVANNLANVNTTGFKKSRAEFADLFYQVLYPQATLPVRVEVGAGVRPLATTRVFSGGPLNPTGEPLDLAIEGDGFFMVDAGERGTLYTRSGSFHVDADGNIVNAEGYMLLDDGEDAIQVDPQDAVSVEVGPDGTVYEVQADGTRNDVGQIGLARFPNPSGLLATGGSLLAATEASGEATTGTPDTEGLGRILPGFLEGSNVEVATEMVNLIVAQRAYELNAKAVQAADEAIGLANNLRRG